jgi:hypothetical protein
VQRNVALDILKLTLAVMVVGLHAGFLGDVSPLAEYLTVNGLFRMAVPIFLLINGFFFYPFLEGGKYINWFKRVSILYLVWTLFYSYFWVSFSGSFFVDIIKLVRNIVIGYHHLWYLAGMLGAAGVMVLLRNIQDKTLIGVIIITFTTGVLIQYAGNYGLSRYDFLNELFNRHWLHRNFLFFSLPFFAIGFLVRKHELHLKMPQPFVISMSVVGIVLLMVESYFNFLGVNRAGGFDNYLSLIVACPFIFILFSKVSITSTNKSIALYSTAIFFIHSLFISLFDHYFEVGGTSLTFYVLFASLVASFFLIQLNRKYSFIL